MRPTNLIVTIVATTGLALATGCAQQADEKPSADAQAVSEEAVAPPLAGQAAAAPEAADGDEAPGLTTTAAPGVAFSYRYAFSLPGDAISGVQQQHAAACEELGPQRCQVTGMDFRQESGGAISARLDFLVDPGIAHRFGKDATDIVGKADGVLDTADVAGDDAGAEIEASQLRSAGLAAELLRIEKRLSGPGLSTAERGSLAARTEAIRSELRSEESARSTDERNIATTPMTFSYASQGLFATTGDPFGKAAENSWGSMKTMLGFILTLLGVALPWLMLAGLIVLAVRGLRRRPAAVGNSRSAAPEI